MLWVTNASFFLNLGWLFEKWTFINVHFLKSGVESWNFHTSSHIPFLLPIFLFYYIYFVTTRIIVLGQRRHAEVMLSCISIFRIVTMDGLMIGEMNIHICYDKIWILLCCRYILGYFFGYYWLWVLWNIHNSFTI